MIDQKMPVSALGRYGSWLTQLLPVVLIRIGVSLGTVLRVYSLSFIAFHALIFWLLAFKLKDRRATYVLPIALTAGFHYMFYYGVSELYQGLSLTVLLWSIVGRAMVAGARRAHLRWFAIAFALMFEYVDEACVTVTPAVVVLNVALMPVMVAPPFVT